MLILSIFVSFIMSLVAGLHFYWAFGGNYGLSSAAPSLEGELDFKPGRILTFLVACLIAVLAILSVQLKWPWQPIKEFVSYIGYFVSATLIVRGVGDFKYVGVFKKVYNSDFAKLDTKYFSPLIFLLGIAYAVLSKFGIT